jgi:membrane fusion protein (multidrug efflux system)
MAQHATRFRPALAALTALTALSLPACHPTHAGEKAHEHAPNAAHADHAGHAAHQNALVGTNPLVKDVLVTQQYVCQIRSQRHIEIRALQEGYLEPIHLKEGQTVKAGDVLFKVVPTLYQARLAADLAEAKYAQIKFENTKRLFECTPPIVSAQEVALAQAELEKANAKAKAAQAEVDFTVVRAPFDGIIDRLSQQQGSLVKKEEALTTLSDNSVVWAKFNVPEARFFEYMSGTKGKTKRDSRIELADTRIELVLANGDKFEYDAGNTVTIEGEFNRETGNIQFRADFPNSEGLLRHGLTGTVLIRRTLHRALVIPQRATFEFLDKRYVFVVGADNVVHQRLITVGHELDDIFVVTNGLEAGDRIVVEGVKQVSEGQNLTGKIEFKKPELVLAEQKHPAQ